LIDVLRETPAPRHPGHAPALPDIELIEVIGRGGSGRVWKGRLKRTSQLVAVKVLTGGAHADARQQERFLREVEILSRLDHPGVIRLNHFGLTADGYYFSMTYLPRGSLSDDRERTHAPWSVRRAVEAMAAVARAVQHAHDRHVIHRDLKPGNILLADDGRPIVADFGIAKLMTGANTTSTSAGTPCYMAPEQAAGHAVDARTDVYGIGAVLYELLTGCPPVPAGESDADTIRRVADSHTSPVHPMALRPEVPAELDRVILKCLEKEPAHRYQLAAEVADELDRYLAGKPVRVRPVGRPARAARWARRNPTTAALTAALCGVVLAALVATTVLWRSATAEAARANAEAAEAVRQRGLTRAALLAHADALTKAYEHITLTSPAERERFGGAIERVLAVLDESGDEPLLQRRTAVALVRFGIILRRNHEPVPAERLLRTASEYLARLAERRPDDKWLWCDYSDALAEHGCTLAQVAHRSDVIARLRTAEAVAAVAAERWPDSDHAKGTLAGRRFSLAVELTCERQFDEAERLFQAALGPVRELARKYPHDYSRHEILENLTRGLGQLHLDRDGDTDRYLAIHAEWDAHVDGVRAREPEKWSQLTRPWAVGPEQATVLARLGRREEAAEAMARSEAGCRAADPAGPDAECRLATNLALAATLFRAGDPRVASYCEEAIRLYDQPKLTPVAGHRLQRHATFLVRCPMPQLRNADRALKLARQAVAIDPASTSAPFTLAECLLATGDLANAEKTLDQWLPKLSGTRRIHPLVHRASIRFRSGRKDAARADLEEATTLARNDWRVSWVVLDELVTTAKLIDGITPDLTPVSHPAAE
jgi:tetratricopeptide (TPR) repeat protein